MLYLALVSRLFRHCGYTLGVVSRGISLKYQCDAVLGILLLCLGLEARTYQPNQCQ